MAGERFSPRFMSAERCGNTTVAEKNTKTARATKRAQKKGKYTIHIAPDGTKHMVLNG